MYMNFVLLLKRRSLKGYVAVKSRQPVKATILARLASASEPVRS